MQLSTMHRAQGLAMVAGTSSTRFASSISRRAVISHAKSEEPAESSSGQDSYSKIEAPVRDSIPDGGKPVADREWGQNQLNQQLKSKESNPDTEILGTEVGGADAMRFTGAIPEVANSRLAMLGVFAAVAAELGSGMNVFQQVETAPVPIALTFLTLFIATAVPVLRGEPRRGNGFWSADAEIVNGRVAMVGFFCLVVSTFYTGSFWPIH